jgi:predicted transcriptional regulator of viral defense system
MAARLRQSGEHVVKTLGPQTAKLVEAIHDRGMDVFTVADVRDILGIKAQAASDLIRAAIKRGLVTRMRRGSFLLVPFELGSETVYTGNPYVVGHRLLGDRPHFLSHNSAMELHGMTTQPQFVVRFSTTKPLRPLNKHGVEIRFVIRRPENMFGITDVWATPQQRVPVSDIERTIIDGLHEPTYVGGYAEIDKGAWMRRGDIDPDKLVDYALRLGVGAVIRRLGFLMDSCEIGGECHRATLTAHLTPTFSLLDPLMPKGGPYLSRWRLQVNVDPDELKGARST